MGAFAMGAGESRVMEGGASLLGASGGVKSSAAIESLGDEGSAEACKASQDGAKENERCAVPLRIGLLAIDRPAPEPGADSGAMVAIPAGSFMMGSPDGEGEGDEHPQHRVSVAGFSMDVTEVTVAAYAKCVSAGACGGAGTAGVSAFCNYGRSDKDNHPINCVNWDQATAYCAWAGKRLPTEEEWEYAARGTDGRTFPWGSSAPGGNLCWNRGTSKAGTCAVGTYAPGAFGLKDMAGNVWEWTSSRYSEDYSKDRTSSAHVLRGGDWFNGFGAFVRSAYRLRLAPPAGDVLGFRCARDAQP